LFKALISASKRLSIRDYILSITADNYIVNDSIVDRFKKHAIESVEKGYHSKLVFNGIPEYVKICCISHFSVVLCCIIFEVQLFNNLDSLCQTLHDKVDCSLGYSRDFSGFLSYLTN